MSTTETKPLPLFSLPYPTGVTVGYLIEKVIDRFRSHDLPQRAASVAFFAMIAMVPIFAIVLTLFVNFVPNTASLMNHDIADKAEAITRFRTSIRKVVPDTGYDVIDKQIERFKVKHPISAVVFILAAAIWTGSSVFSTLFKIMTEIYENADYRHYFWRKGLALIVTVLQSLIFFATLLVFFMWPVLEPFIMASGDGHLTSALIDWVVLAIVTLVSFCTLMHVGPHLPRYFPLITPGALAATPVFLIVTGLFRIYVQNSTRYDVLYGPLGGIMILMLWFWLTAMIILGGTAVDSVIKEAQLEGQLDEDGKVGEVESKRLAHFH